MADSSRREQIETMLKQNPNDTFLQYALAMELQSEGNQEAALARFADIAESAPDYVPLYFQWGQLLAQSGLLDKAQSVLKRGITVAQGAGDHHAAEEMNGLLMSLAPLSAD